jgi:hypothetical protein
VGDLYLIQRNGAQLHISKPIIIGIVPSTSSTRRQGRKLVLAEVVRDEVEENLLLHAERLTSIDADQWIDDYQRLIKLTNPELVPYPDKRLVRSSRNLIRHEAVPVLLSAIASKPDWLLTHNTSISPRRPPSGHKADIITHRDSSRVLPRAFGFVPVNAGYVPLDKRDLPPGIPSAVRILAYVPFRRESTYALETFTRE